jgi:glycosyltransferase involved in cell wall biosynthesis
VRAKPLRTAPSEPLRIVHVVRGPIGGILRHIADLAQIQTGAGHHVALICDSLTGGTLENDEVSALSAQLAGGVSRIPMRRELSPRDVVSGLSVARRLGALAPDVVHAHGAKGGVFGRLGAMALRARGRRVAAFYAPHGGSLHFEPTTYGGRLYFTVERALESVTDGLIHVSAYEAAAYRSKVGVPHCPAHPERNA